MYIKEITSDTREIRKFDFRAIMVCEHCGHEQELSGGYNDRNYHINVVPTKKCGKCGKCSDNKKLYGGIPEEFLGWGLDC